MPSIPEQNQLPHWPDIAPLSLQLSVIASHVGDATNDGIKFAISRRSKRE